MTGPRAGRKALPNLSPQSLIEGRITVVGPIFFPGEGFSMRWPKVHTPRPRKMRQMVLMLEPGGYVGSPILVWHAKINEGVHPEASKGDELSFPKHSLSALKPQIFPLVWKAESSKGLSTFGAKVVSERESLTSKKTKKVHPGEDRKCQDGGG